MTSKDQVTAVDICCGLSYGDEAKGKIVSHLLNSDKSYDCVCRWNGGHNAGHTIYRDGKKYKTHLIPTGVFYGVTSIIGPNCVLNVKKFFDEIEYLKGHGFNTDVIRVHPNCHIITDKHLEEDATKYKDTQGSTSTGVAPCYRDKSARIGVRAQNVSELKDYIMDFSELKGVVLCEGAQGFWLDINYGNYPYVTSSQTLPCDACSLGFPPQKIRNIIGACKIYDTRSGIDPDFPETLFDDPELLKLADTGNEYGTTTGRRRKVNWLNLDKLVDAINISGANVIIMSKVDIVETLGIFKLYYSGKLMQFKNCEEMKQFIESTINEKCNINSFTFSSALEGI